jgi:geranylgeranyl reductase family protein
LTDTEYDYDVIIIGCGPAGASASAAASGTGARVLVIEKRKEIGVPIQCGEFMPTSRELKDLLPSLQHVDNVEYPSRIVENRTKYIRIISPGGDEYTFELESDIIDREKFDKLLVQRTLRNGGELSIDSIGSLVSRHDGVSEVAVKRKTETKRVTAGMVIAADGARSRTASKAGLEILSSPYDLSPVLQRVMGGVDVEQDTTEMYFSREYAPGGFAWIIPKGDGIANVGLGIRSPFSESGVTISGYFERFVEKHPIASKKLERASAMSAIGGLVPCGGAIPKTYADGVLAAGDSAGHVLASTGAGIPLSVVSGQIAGEVASSRVLRGGPPLESYEKQWRKEIGKEIKNSHKIRELGDVAMKKDSRMDRLLEILGQDRIAELIRCRIPFGLQYATTLVKSVAAAL